MLISFYPGAVSPCYAPVGLVGHTLLSVGEMRWRVNAQSHGEVSSLWQSLRGLCSRHMMSCSWDQSASDKDGQVFLACFQGDADEASGYSSHCIYIYIYIRRGRWSKIKQRQLYNCTTHRSRVPVTLRKDALSENQINEGASDISRASAKGGNSRAVPPQTSYCAPRPLPSSPLLAECDRF